MKKNLILFIFTLLLSVSYAQKEKFQVNGAARGYIFANDLNIDNDIDSVTTRKSNYGHTLLDLGFNIFPNDNTEVLGMFRIRNELGGFWGGGVSFNVRQLTVRGVAGGVVKYELGDIDLKMTPYTLFNNIEEGVVNEADAFAIRRDIVHYDMFYNTNNSWRMQGAKAKFGLQMGKNLKSIDFNGYITRQRVSDGVTLPERLYGGGSIFVNQSENFNIGFNSINLFDLTETLGEDSIQYKNSVHTTNFMYKYKLQDNIKIGFKGEAGMSNAQYINYLDVFAPDSLKDWFYDAALTSDFKKQNITVALGYKDVGADFSSPGAQTKRVNYSKFPGVYQQFTNDFIGRATSYSDVINGDAENSFRITEELMAYNIAYNNTNPYGVATPNRKGIYLDVTKKDSTKFRESFLNAAMLTESRGSGTNNKKNFLLVRAGTDLYINDFFDWKKDLKIDLGVQYESTSRSGETYEKVALSSMFIDAGITYEFAKKLNLLAGLKIWSAKGNEFTPERNQYNTIVDYFKADIDFVETVYAAGLKYDFNSKNSLSAQYQVFDLKQNTDFGVDYSINQFNILYRLFF